MKAIKKCCGEEQSCISQIILSKEATTQILGENLSVLIAIGKNGQAMRFLPYGSEIVPESQNCSNEESVGSFEVAITVQKNQAISRNVLRFVRSPSKKSFISAKRCLCKFMGKEWYC